MKSIFYAIAISLLALQAYAQGTVNFLNTVETRIRTNDVGIGGTAGYTAGGAGTGGSFIYALLTAPSSVTSVSLSLHELTTEEWTFTGLYATNTALGGRLNGGGGATTLQGWPTGQTNSFIIVGCQPMWVGRIGIPSEEN